MSTKTSVDPAPRLFARLLARPLTYVFMGFGILLVDLTTGRYLLFPILFVLPVSLCAWHCSVRWAYALAVLLPIGRLFIAEFVDHPAQQLSIAAINALIRIAVLVLLAFFVDRAARQTEALKQQVAGFVTMCAWSRTVEFEGEWISFEDYLKRRFNLDTNHGISPSEAQKVIDGLNHSSGRKT